MSNSGSGSIVVQYPVAGGSSYRSLISAICEEICKAVRTRLKLNGIWSPCKNFCTCNVAPPLSSEIYDPKCCYRIHNAQLKMILRLLYLVGLHFDNIIIINGALLFLHGGFIIGNDYAFTKSINIIKSPMFLDNFIRGIVNFHPILTSGDISFDTNTITVEKILAITGRQIITTGIKICQNLPHETNDKKRTYPALENVDDENGKRNRKDAKNNAFTKYLDDSLKSCWLKYKNCFTNSKDDGCSFLRILELLSPQAQDDENLNAVCFVLNVILEKRFGKDGIYYDATKKINILSSWVIYNDFCNGVRDDEVLAGEFEDLSIVKAYLANNNK